MSTSLKGRERMHPLSLSESPILTLQPDANVMDDDFGLIPSDVTLGERYCSIS